MPIGREEIRHRFGYHPGTSETIPKHERIREAYVSFAEFLDEVVPDGRAKALVFTSLQESSQWANFAVAETAPLEPKRRYNIITSDKPAVHSSTPTETPKATP